LSKHGIGLLADFGKKACRDRVGFDLLAQRGEVFCGSKEAGVCGQGVGKGHGEIRGVSVEAEKAETANQKTEE